MSAADAWQAGLAMAKECESLQSQLTQARAELERERGWRRLLHRFTIIAVEGRELGQLEADTLSAAVWSAHEEIQAAEEVSTREELIDE